MIEILPYKLILFPSSYLLATFFCSWTSFTFSFYPFKATNTSLVGWPSEVGDSFKPSPADELGWATRDGCGSMSIAHTNMSEANLSITAIPKKPTAVQVGNSINEIPILNRLVRRGRRRKIGIFTWSPSDEPWMTCWSGADQPTNQHGE